jgi:hypothetical protein
MAAMANAEVFGSYFRRADLDKDGRISGQEAVGFFPSSELDVEAFIASEQSRGIARRGVEASAGLGFAEGVRRV